MKKEIRTYQIQEFRVITEEEKPKFRGYAAVFNELSDDLGGFRERIAPGAFAESILKDDIRALFNHDANFVLGRNKVGTLRLLEDEKGLYFEVDAPNAQWVRDLSESVARGDIDQCSFGFVALEDEWVKEGGKDIRTLKRCQLFDVSIVTYPAYPQTNAQVRSAKEVYAEKQKENQKVKDQILKEKLKLYKEVL